MIASACPPNLVCVAVVKMNAVHNEIKSPSRQPSPLTSEESRQLSHLQKEVEPPQKSKLQLKSMFSTSDSLVGTTQGHKNPALVSLREGSGRVIPNSFWSKT